MRKIMMVLFVAAAFAGGCKSSTMADVKSGAKKEACNTSCDEAKAECVEKCSEEADQDACKLACDAARDKCAKDCKNS